MEDLIMVRTLEELKEMIDNTIIENDKGEITATSLNLVLQDMSDSLSAMGGGGQFDIYCAFEFSEDGIITTTCDEEQKVKNKEVFDKILAGEMHPLVLHVDTIENYMFEGVKVNISGTCTFDGIMYDMSSELSLSIVGVDTDAVIFLNISGTIELGHVILLPNGEMIIVGL